MENGSFTPLVFSNIGGMSRECSLFFKRLLEKFADKQNAILSETTCYIRTKLSFALIKGVVLCIRRSRGRREKYYSVDETHISLVNHVLGAME